MTQTWDTLQIEMLLSPEYNTYALKVPHNARLDAEHTLKLFINQILRILILDEEKYNIINCRFFFVCGSNTFGHQ